MNGQIENEKNLKQTILVSELLDIVLETEEEEHSHPQVDSTVSGDRDIKLSHLRLTNMINMVLKKLGDIPESFEEETPPQGRQAYSAMGDLIKQIAMETKQKLQFVLVELHSIDTGDSCDLFRESAYTLSETCTDIENTLRDFLKSVTPTSKRIINNGIFFNIYVFSHNITTEIKINI